MKRKTRKRRVEDREDVERGRGIVDRMEKVKGKRKEGVGRGCGVGN